MTDDADGAPVSSQQLATARHCSRKYRCPTDEESLLALARLVPAGFTGDRPKDQAWKYELRHGRMPTRDAVRKRAYFLRVKALHQPQLKHAAEVAAHLDYDRLGPQLAKWVNQYRNSHDTGPSWSQVGTHWGWDRDHTNAIIRAAHTAGWLASTDQPNSLRPAHPHTDSAVPHQPTAVSAVASAS